MNQPPQGQVKMRSLEVFSQRIRIATHNPEVLGSNPSPLLIKEAPEKGAFFLGSNTVRKHSVIITNPAICSFTQGQ